MRSAVKLMFSNEKRIRPTKENRKKLQQFIEDYLQNNRYSYDAITIQFKRHGRGIKVQIRNLNKLPRSSLLSQLGEALLASTT